VWAHLLLAGEALEREGVLVASLLAKLSLAWGWAHLLLAGESALEWAHLLLVGESALERGEEWMHLQPQKWEQEWMHLNPQEWEEE